MGYRHKIGILPKLLHEEIKRMTYKQLVEKHGDPEGYVGAFKITKEVYCMGKYCELGFLDKHSRPVFEIEETNLEFNHEREFFIINKEGFEEIIEHYRKKILNSFKHALATPDTMRAHLEDMRAEWDNNFNCRPYEINGECISNSWKYEYAIFEVVRIYKSVNWEKELVTITAW